MTVSFPNQLRTTEAPDSKPTPTHWNETVIKTCKFIGYAIGVVGPIYYLGGFEGINGRFFLPEIKMNRVFTCLAEAALLIGIAGYFEYKRSQGKEEFSSAIRARFPIDFLEQISRSNRAQPFNAPNALILTAESDHNEGLTGASTLFFFLAIAKTHRVAFQIIKNKNEIRTAIQYYRNLTRPIQSLIFNTHSGDSTLELGKSGEVYTVADVCLQDFEGLAPNAEIFLKSCHAGSREKKGLAKTIADTVDRIVFATPDFLCPSSTCFSFCDAHQRLEMFSFEKDEQDVLRFQKGQQPFACSRSKASMASYFSEMEDYIRNRIDLGEPDAFSEEGYLYQQRGDLPAAKFWYHKAAGYGHAGAQRNLGYHCQREDDLANAKVWYKRAAEQGDHRAQRLLGTLYQEEDQIKAKFWLKEAAYQGDPEAQRILGDLYNKEGDLPKAKFWYKNAADHEDPVAQCNLGFLYDNENDLINAKIWYRRAADHGDSAAQYNLGILYKMENDLKNAKIWLNKAADQGRPDAQFLLGDLYRKEGDPTNAKIWYQKSADQGNRVAQCNLGFLYDSENDLANAKIWYKKAADQGLPDAQRNLELLREKENKRNF